MPLQDAMLYYVRADDDDGENLDLMVQASGPEQAVILWDEHFDLEGQVSPQWVGRVPVTGFPGVIPWDKINPGGDSNGLTRSPN